MTKNYLPNTGDIIRVHFALPPVSKALDYKPAVILSPSAYNKKTGLIVCCAITQHIKGYPFEVLIATEPPSVVLTDQVKSIDWVNSKISHHGRISSAELAEIRAKLQALLLKS
ncbi:MAG TPA: type II toxin-antitoxin system PemK/MazF family toxin [Eoetvoesiella sp.]